VEVINVRLGLRDAVATLLAAVGVLAAFSVVAGWNWPLMNGVQTGIIVLGVTGLAACVGSGWMFDLFNRKLSFSSPYVMLGSLLGVAVLAVGVIGLFANTAIWLTLMILGVVGLWLVTGVHRLYAGAASRPVTAA
jgi:hypothetical protein